MCAASPQADSPTFDPEPSNQVPTDDALARHRRVRSFVKREGRLTPGQQRALETLGPRFLLPAGDTPIQPQTRFPHMPEAATPRDIVLEIGFGNGASLAEQAERYPDTAFIGVEVHRPGVGHLLLEVERRGLNNLCAIEQDAVEVIARLADASLAGVQIYFPDPWHKKRHHKRRLIQSAFLETLARVVRPGGYLHLATDWEDYACHMAAVLDQSGQHWRADGAQPLAAPPAWRSPTKFERRGQRLGHNVRDFLYRRR